MNRNLYVDLCLHLQALRRQAEEVRNPLMPAIGVAASLYTHQLANVHRVLTDVRVRHLLADEVGLGKTVQALMVLNALRRQRRDLHALIIVPDRLVTQWRDELMTRAHTAPYDTDAPGEGQYVRLAWAPNLTLADIDPTRYQVLVVDELHWLRTDLQDRIVRVAAEFEHLLVLTATPSFQRPERHAQLFALLEPERTTRARWEIADHEPELIVSEDLSKWPKWAARRIVDAFLMRDNDAAANVDTDSLPATAMALCSYRRVIRTRRVDYAGVLPHRQHYPVLVEPLGAEVDRQALMWKYFTHLDDLSRTFNPVLLAKRTILSPPSIEQRVDFFRRRGHERDGLLDQVKPLVHKSNGDSRADALIDVLAAIWARAPRERILVAAQDNLTVDYLFNLVQARLPEIGPIGERVPLVAARVRQGMETDAVEDIGGYGNETNTNLEAFQQGKAQILFAPDAAQVGLNLQCARVLVLYSVPWRPEEVEQWIGRLDRIGNVAAFSSEGAASTIDVYTIAQHGLVDEKVVTVLQRFNAFEHSVNLDGTHLEEVARAIEEAALCPENFNWRNLEERSESMAAEDAVQELDSALRPHLPWDVRWAKDLRNHLDSLPPVAPVIGDIPEPSSVGPKAWDRAIEPMFKLLKRAGEYYLRKNTDPRTGKKFLSLWYCFGEREIYGYKPVTAKVVFRFVANPHEDRHPRNAHAFITRRGDIGTPPRREVYLELNDNSYLRPLHFANFGDAMHDELIDEWAKATPTINVLDVMFFADHKLWDLAEPGWFLIRMTLLDPAMALNADTVLKKTEEEIAAAVTESANDRIPDMMSPFTSAARCALEADVRWLRASLSASSRLTGRWKSPQGWQDMSEEAIAALLNPMAHNRDELPRAFETTDPTIEEELNRQCNMIRDSDRNGGQLWSAKLPTFATDLRARLRVIEEEARDALELTRREVVRTEAALIDAKESGNRAQITRASNLRNVAVDVAAMNEVYWRQRKAWLCACEEAIPNLRPRKQFLAAIRARRAAT